MRSALAALLLLGPLRARAADFADLTAAGAPAALLRDLRQSAAKAADVAGRPVSYPVVARVTLGSDGDFLRTGVTFPLKDGRLVHVSGNKDQSEGLRDGYFLSFLADGASQPVWVSPDNKKPVAFSIEGERYTVIILTGGIGLLHLVNDIKLLRHPEAIRIRIERVGDGSFHREFTVGELINAMSETGRPVTLGRQVYYASYVRQIKEIKGAPPPGAVQLLDKFAVLLLPKMEPKRDSNGRLAYKLGWADRLAFDAAQAEGVDASGAPRIARAQGQDGDNGGGAGEAYGFHLDDGPAGKTLVVYDLTR